MKSSYLLPTSQWGLSPYEILAYISACVHLIVWVPRLVDNSRAGMEYAAENAKHNSRAGMEYAAENAIQVVDDTQAANRKLAGKGVRRYSHKVLLPDSYRSLVGRILTTLLFQ
ncbi:hypothetical protein R1sor_010698 [Riccia sorocarpa]|uniref:Uncharacterized protein n=1 Tax=Riccia sorocarpa TaxID=122646 RepID=A0ABD3I1I8_9MARC